MKRSEVMNYGTIIISGKFNLEQELLTHPSTNDNGRVRIVYDSDFMAAGNKSKEIRRLNLKFHADESN
ncbi:hypothetical protein TNCV_2168451 [Trichonephila clavipes]|nr:hypothetical protein TNCV_2168451 [Trichonephila clavipes]